MNILQRNILSLLLKKPAPKSIPRSGEKALSVDCNVIYLRDKDESWSLYVNRVDSHGLYGKIWLHQDEADEFCIPYKYLNEYKIEIIHFLGIYELTYHSFLKYILEDVLPVNRLKIALGKAKQLLFNRKKLVRTERIEVLKIILEIELENTNSTFGVTQLTTHLYTQRWVYHPDKSVQFRYNQLLLDSLVESGDLRKAEYGYKLQPKALITISDYERDNKKHQEGLDEAKAMKWLTFALIFVGLVQSAVSLYGVINSGS